MEQPNNNKKGTQNETTAFFQSIYIGTKTSLKIQLIKSPSTRKFDQVS